MGEAPSKGRLRGWLAWLAWFACVAALCASPRWLTLDVGGPDAARRSEFAPDADARIGAWLDAPDDRSPYAFEPPLMDGQTVFAFLHDERGERLGFLALRPGAQRDGSAYASRSFGIHIDASGAPPEAAAALERGARRIVERDDGSVLRAERREFLLIPAPEGFAWLGYGLAAAALSLALRDRLRLPSAAGAQVKRTHLLPVAIQLTIFGYWALYWAPVRLHAPLLLAQLAFGYGLDVALAWALRRPWPAPFAVAPLVLSANLFVWFPPEQAAMYFALVAAALASKALLRREGRHVFNPSAFAASLVALLTIFVPSYVRYTDVSHELSMAPGMSEVMFLLTLVPLSLLGLVDVTLGAVAAMTVGRLLMHGLPGYTWAGTFLAVTIFAGDPMTVPSSRSGRLLFGAFVGLGIQIGSVLLLRTVGSDFWSKVLVIPLANALVPRFEEAGARASAGLDRLAQQGRWRAAAACAALLLLALFGAEGAAMAAAAYALFRLRAAAPRARTAAAIAAWSALYLLRLWHDKPGGFDGRTHERWLTPLVCPGPGGGLRCQENPAFCEPFRFDLEARLWTLPPERRCPGAAPR